MTKELLTFQRFESEAMARDLYEFLLSQGFEVDIENESQTFDPSFSMNPVGMQEFRVKLKGEDFDRARGLLETQAQNQDEPLPEDHYLLKFTESELLDVLAYSDEWSPFDAAWALKILESRGRRVPEEELHTLRQKRLEELARPEESQQSWIGLGYLFALAGGFLGIIIGYHLSRFKKTLPNGNRVFAYSQTDRIQGNRIFLLGIISQVIWMILFFWKWGNKG